DSEGNQIAQDDDGGIGVNSYLNYTSVTGGTFLIGDSSFADTGTGAYTLTVSDTDVPVHIGTDERLSGDEADERLGRIDIPGDADFFGADLVAGARYTITVSGAGDTPLADPFLTVSTGDGTVLATDDDSGPGL